MLINQIYQSPINRKYWTYFDAGDTLEVFDTDDNSPLGPKIPTRRRKDA